MTAYVTKALGYSSEGAPDDLIGVPKVLGYSSEGAPDTTATAAKILGYAFITLFPFNRRPTKVSINYSNAVQLTE